MKAQSAGERADDEAPPKPSGRKAARTEELPLVEQPEAEADEDLWSEVPTVANRNSPARGGGDDDRSSPPGPPEGAGTYRILHPTASDVVETPAPAPVDARPPNRTLIGPTAKPKR